MNPNEIGCLGTCDSDSTKLYIPSHVISPTAGSERFRVSVLCRLFLVGRCRQSARCHQIHADPDVVQRLRQHALANPSCCMAHTPGECAAAARQVLHLLPPGLTLDVEGTMVGVMQLDPTRGLVELCQKAAFSPVIPCTRSQVCRNHSSGSLCRFGDECGFVHICKDTLHAISHRNVVKPLAQNRSRAAMGSLRSEVFRLPQFNAAINSWRHTLGTPREEEQHPTGTLFSTSADILLSFSGECKTHDLHTASRSEGPTQTSAADRSTVTPSSSVLAIAAAEVAPSGTITTATVPPPGPLKKWYAFFPYAIKNCGSVRREMSYCTAE